MPSARSLPSSRRWRSVLSANASSASVTRLCWSASARTSECSVSSTPSASCVPLRHRPPARTVTVSPSTTASNRSAPGVASTRQTPARTSSSGPGIRKAAGARGRHVDDGPHAGFDELLGRDTVEIDVVDDREIAGPKPLDEILRPPAEPGGADDLGHCSGSEAIAVRNSSPPSMRSSSVRRSAAESSSITVWVGIAGHLLDAEVPRRRRSRSAAGA